MSTSRDFELSSSRAMLQPQHQRMSSNPVFHQGSSSGPQQQAYGGGGGYGAYAPPRQQY